MANTFNGKEFLDKEGLALLVSKFKGLIDKNAEQDAALANEVLECFNKVEYNKESKKIVFSNTDNTTKTPLAEIDVTDFIKDGMVSNVEIKDGKLVITFNTDAGDKTIEIALTDIFDPANYYTKEETDEKYVPWSEYQGRKVILLDNYDNIAGKTTAGTGVNLAMVSKWDVADFGSSQIHMNLNSSDPVTVNDKDVVVVKQESASEPGKFVITLDNADLIMGKTNPGELEDKVEVEKGAVVIAQVNKWNVVDLGSPWTVTNINTKAGERVTVQEAGTSGKDAHKIAYLSDIAAANEDLSGAIAAEKARAEAAEGVLSNAIATEKARAEGAESDLNTTINNLYASITSIPDTFIESLFATTDKD